jgi:hypothetical protein
MSLYNPDHLHSNGLELLLDTDSRDWRMLFVLVAERLQRIEVDLATAKQEILELKEASTGIAIRDDSSSSL